jgi:hypothetical protein
MKTDSKPPTGRNCDSNERISLTPKKERLSAIIISVGKRWRRRKSCPKKPSMEFPLYMSFQVMNQTLMDFNTSLKLSQTTHPSLEMTDQRL